MSLTIAELNEILQLPDATEWGFDKDFERSQESFRGVPEFMTMPFVRRYFPWVGGGDEHYAAFERVAAKVAACEALQLYAHHASKALFEYPIANNASFGRWPMPAALGDDAGMFDLMIAMSAIPMWAETHRKMGIPERYSRASATWLNGTLRIYNSAHPGFYGIDRTQVYWLRFNIDAKLFRIGRFEYMIDRFNAKFMPAIYRHKTTGKTVALCGDNWGLMPDGSRMFMKQEEANAPIHSKLEITADTATGFYINAAGFAVVDAPVTLELAEYAPVFAEGDFVPGMHIPGGGNMTVDAAYASWREALEFFPKYLGREVKGVCCNSWIFNPGLERELPDSNLAKLMRELYLFPEAGGGSDGLFFIFGKHAWDENNFKPDNSVRQAFFRIRNSGEMFRPGAMFILPQEMISGDGARYRRENYV